MPLRSTPTDVLGRQSVPAAPRLTAQQWRLAACAVATMAACSRAIIIDRGDLSRQVPIELIPFIQRRIISAARVLSTPVYVATNLLESMCVSPYPTRAEANDIVSTLLMGADGLVLAAETAVGAFPVETVRTLAKIIGHCQKWSENTTISEVLAMR